MKREKSVVSPKLRRLGVAVCAVFGAAGIGLWPAQSDAQINRSRPPASSPSGSGSSSPDRSPSDRSSGDSRPAGSSTRDRAPDRGASAPERSRPSAPVITGRTRDPGSSANSGSSPARGGTDFNGLFGRNRPSGRESSSGREASSGRVPSSGITLSPLRSGSPADGVGLSGRSRPTASPGLSTLQPLAPSRSSDPFSYGQSTRRRDYESGGAFDRFNRSAEGFSFRYGNGIWGRDRYHYYNGWGTSYFPRGGAYYPYYYPRFISGYTCPSLYGYYFGSCPPYIGLEYVVIAPPRYVYVPAPVYNNLGYYYGWSREDVDTYYLNREATTSRSIERETAHDRLLDNSLRDIRRAWLDGDIQLLSRHVRRDTRVSVYLRGKYQYSLDAGDYLDMSRDALQTTKTVKFELDDIRRKDHGIFVVTGSHVYRDKEGAERTVYVSYVVERADDEYYITQVGTAPDRIKD